MKKVAAMEVSVILAVCGVCQSATFCPKAHTYSDVSSMNGSDSNAGCPSVCRIIGANNERFCDCTGVLSDISGVLIDGIIPTFDVTQRGTWASQLYTANTAGSSYVVGFQFSSPFMLREVQLHLFFCPSWSIPARSNMTINVHRALLFPAFVAPTLIGTISLTWKYFNCNSLSRLSITTLTSARAIYFIEFRSTIVGGIYLGEVIFRDDIQVVPTSAISSSATPIINLFTPSSQVNETSSQQTLQTASTRGTTLPSPISSTMKRRFELHTTILSDESTMKQTSELFTNNGTSTEFLNNGATTPNSVDHPSIIIITHTSSALVTTVAVLSTILCIAILVIIGGAVCFAVVLKNRRSIPLHNNNLKQEQNFDDSYDYISDLNDVTDRHEVNTEAREPATKDGLELIKNRAYHVVKILNVIEDENYNC